MIEIKKLQEIRCQGTHKGKPCNRRLFIGEPGFDKITGEPKILYLKCSKCGTVNLVYSGEFGEIIVKIK